MSVWLGLAQYSTKFSVPDKKKQPSDEIKLEILEKNFPSYFSRIDFATFLFMHHKKNK